MHLLLAAALAAATAKAPQAAPPADLRTTCTGTATVHAKSDAGKPAASKVLTFQTQGQRIVSLPSGAVLIVKHENDQDELLLQQDGRYRRLLLTPYTVRYLAESPDAKWVAAVVVVGAAGVMELPQAALYLFDTKTWTGREVAKNFGFTAIAWSPDSNVLAFGDFAKVRLVDAAKGEIVQSCVFDSQATADGDERVMTFAWSDARSLKLVYQNQAVSVPYVVKLP
jgi:WD40 repeat protein